MSKKWLFERYKSALTYTEESFVNKDNRRCLGTLKGPCADYINPTRNDRLYEKQLWINVINSDDFKEAMETKTLFGELDHPETRLETLIKMAAIVLTNIEFDDENGSLIGTFDILDTPNGRLLKSLCDYGCIIGISSRGEGDVIQDQFGKLKVDPNTYEFYGFDAVISPANKIARPEYQDSGNEGKLETFTESVKSQINDTQSVSDLSMMKTLLESTQVKNVNVLTEAIDNRITEITEGDNVSSSIINDFKSITLRVKELEEENRLLKESAGNSRDSEISRLNDLLKKSVSRANSLLSEVSTLRKDNRQLTESVKSLTKGNRILSKKIKVVESKSNKELLDMNNTVVSLEKKLSDSKSLIESVKISNEDELSDTRKLLESSSNEISKLNDLLYESEQSLHNKDKIIKQMKNKLANTESRLKEVIIESKKAKDQLSSTTTLLESTRRSDNTKSGDINHLKGVVNKITKDKSLLESKLSSIESKYSKMRSQYLNSQSARYGLDSKTVSDLLPNNYDHADIDRVIKESLDRRDRLNQVPINLTESVNTSKKVVKLPSDSVDKKLSDEDRQTLSILNGSVN